MAVRRSLSMMMGAILGIVLFAVGFVTYVAISGSERTPIDAVPIQVNSDLLQSTAAAPKFVSSATDLEKLVEHRSHKSRDIAMRSLVADTNVEQLRTLLQISKEIRSPALRDEFQSILAQKYATLDPKDALAHVEYVDEQNRDKLKSIIFGEWVHTDLEDAVNFAGSLDPLGKRAAVEGIASSKRELSNELLVRIAKQLEHEDVVRDHISMSKLDTPIKNPREEWSSFLAENDSDIRSISEIQNQLLTHILHSWIVEEGPSIVPIAMASLRDNASRIATFDRLIQKTATSHPQNARSVTSIMLVTDRDMVIRSMESWARTDPNGAFEFASSLSDDGARDRLQRATIRSWAITNPTSLLESMELVPARLKPWCQRVAVNVLASAHPELAAAEVSTMPEGPGKSSLLNNIAQQWFESDPDAVTDWAKTDPELSTLVESLIYSAIMDTARTDPETALNMALQQEVDDSGVGYEALVVRQVATYDVEQAIDLLKFARNTQTRGRAYSFVGQVLIQEGETKRALALVEDVSEEVEFQYYQWISVFWINRNAQEVYSKLGELPSARIKNLYATLLLNKNGTDPFLDSDKAENLETLLFEENENAINVEGEEN